MTLKLKLAVDVPENVLSDLMITAFDGDYGGCWHWSEPYGDDWLVTKPTGINSDWVQATVLDNNDEDEDISSRVYKVDWSILVLGMQRIIDEDKKHPLIEAIAEAIFNDNAGGIDSGQVDTIVQYGLFMEEVYS